VARQNDDMKISQMSQLKVSQVTEKSHRGEMAKFLGLQERSLPWMRRFWVFIDNCLEMCVGSARRMET
jgi:hypothetical protein